MTRFITQKSDVEGAVGKRVTLSGTIENSRIAQLLGVDVESESPDLRGRAAIAHGTLEREVVTQAEIDRRIAQHGQFAHRGPGTYYRLVDPQTRHLVQVREIPAHVLPSGRFQLEEHGTSLTVEATSPIDLRLVVRGDTIVEGTYAITAMKMADFHATFTIDAREGPLARPLDTDMSPGTKLKVTLHYGCSEGRTELSFALHDAGPDGRQVVSRTLTDFASHCTSGPAIDGAKINPRR